MNTLKELKAFIILWLTQTLSSLGSGMTSYALVIWLYQETGSALSTALLTVCSYAPYIVMSIFAGAISDTWNKKHVMLICDTMAAVTTVVIFVLLSAGKLEIWHLYALNALNGLMNTVQQPASDVATTLLVPQKHYQKTSGMRSFSGSMVSILTPIFATTMVTLAGVEAVIFFDLITFIIAFIVLLLFIQIPEIETERNKKERLWKTALSGIQYLRDNKGIMWLILFLAAINLVASVYNAALPALVLSKQNENTLGLVNSCTGVATLAGSVLATFLPEPKSRIKVIFNCLFLSMSTENFLLAFGGRPWIWCVAALLGWIAIPLMNANMNVVLRTNIPTGMQGRVYASRNTLQFFTIPIGYFLGGILVDKVFEPFMALKAPSFLKVLFGTGKGSGAAFLFFIIGMAGVVVCMIFRKVKYIWELDK